MFIDETRLELSAGDGGNGCFSYERQKYKPKGKPDGGNGGRGGNICLVGSPQVHTLQDVAYRHHYRAERGVHGKGKNMYGRSGEDIKILVPLGTMVYNDETDEILTDCLVEGREVVVARGGRGGRGNGTIASYRNRNPEGSEPGKPGEVKVIRLVLKMLADVGLVGRPNAGKSTFLSRISHARPKVADYPFTTTKPHLGIVRVKDGFESFVVADIPGIIEDCHTGKGLGIRFLKHIERTKVLAILIDAATEDPQADAQVLLHELEQYSSALAEKPVLFILTKKDTLDKPAVLPHGWEIMSAVTGDGVDGVVWKLFDLVKKHAPEVYLPEQDLQQ